MKRRFSEGELEDAIRQHKRWLLSGEEIPGTGRVLGEGGEFADFSNADLRGMSIGGGVDLGSVSFRSADLRGARIIQVNLNSANLQGADLDGANFYGSTLYGANLQGAKIQRTNFYKVDLRRANLQGIMLEGADFTGANLQGQNFEGARLHAARLREADLSQADLRGAVLAYADLTGADLSGADLTGAYLDGAAFVSTQVDQAIFTRCQVYGVSVWDLKGEPKDQSNLIIKPRNQNSITVDNLDVAQFLYLLLNNKKVRQVIDAVTTKVVLILGRFTEERIAVLDAIRSELRRRDFTPILFDFEKPASKDVTGTVETLARMARFIIADLTNPSSIPHELATIVPFLRTTPVLPLRLAGSGGYSMFEDFQHAYSWVLDTHEYVDGESLISSLSRVIAPADAMADKLRKSA